MPIVFYKNIPYDAQVKSNYSKVNEELNTLIVETGVKLTINITS
jgi:hypothetical protein